ncbi:MAG: hypothetical protein AAGC60_27230 [Acidobacteriota bacterium]
MPTLLFGGALLVIALVLTKGEDPRPREAVETVGEPGDGSASRHGGEHIAAGAQLSARDRRVVASMWWHDERSASLGLDAAQLRAMDARTGQLLVERRRLAVVDPRFGAAFAAGDVEAARVALAARADVAARRAVIDETWMLDILELLKGEQRARLVADRPDLLRTPWLVRVGGEARRRARAQRTAPPQTAPPQTDNTEARGTAMARGAATAAGTAAEDDS